MSKLLCLITVYEYILYSLLKKALILAYRSLNLLKCLYSTWRLLYYVQEKNCPNNFDAFIMSIILSKSEQRLQFFRNSFQDADWLIDWGFIYQKHTDSPTFPLSKLNIIYYYLRVWMEPNQNTWTQWFMGESFFIYFLFLSKSTKISYNSLLESIDNNGFCVCLFLSFCLLCVLILGH